VAVAYQEFTYTTRSTNSPVSATKPAGTASGDLLVAFCFATVGGGWSAPGDWNTAEPSPPTGGGVFWRTAGGSEPSTYDFGFSNPVLASMRVVIVRFTGAHPSAPIDAISTVSGTGSNQVVPGVTVGYAAAMLFNFFGHVTSTAAVTAPSGTTSAFNDGTGVRKVGAYEFPGATGASGSRTWTNGTNGRLAVLVSIRPDATDHTKSLSDSATASDALAKGVGKGLSDSASATDTLTKAVGKGLADSVTPADEIDLDTGYERSLSDSVTPADEIALDTGYERALSDSVAPADDVALDVGKGLSDSVTATDEVALETGYEKDLSDSVTPTDEITRRDVGKGFADSVTATDEVALDTGYERSLSDSATPVDEVSLGPGKGLADSVTPTDEIVVSLVFDKSLADDVTPTDEVTLAVGKGLSDDVTPADEIQITSGTERQLSDSVAATDEIVVSRGIYLTLADTVGCTEDFPVVDPSRSIRGFVYDHESEAPGTVIPGATVRLFRTQDDALCQVTTTDSAGYYEFARDASDPYTYYVTVQVDGPTQVHGISDRGILPEPV
jgi:hypothetical protein